MTYSIFEFREPGGFLKQRYQALKEAEPGISHRYISACLGFRSPAVFCQIVNGRIQPSAKSIDGLARVFKLDAMERDFLAHLFMLRKIADERLRTQVLAGLYSGYGSGAAVFSNR
ncbi:MAG: hypothetical protein JF616_01470 [Fibrobacteres bacterium]|nr:hypothetical protein [Fibrobacterota bacterium]